MKDSRPCCVFDALNLGESMPITTSRVPKRSSSCFSAGSMWMQLMHPGVKKSSSTARPRKSVHASGRDTLNQVSACGKATARCAWARGSPVSSPAATISAEMRVNRMRFMRVVGCSIRATGERVHARVQCGDALSLERWLRRQDVAMLQLFDVPLLVEQAMHLGAGHAEGWALHFVLGIVKRDEQTGAARRQLQVHVDGEPFAHPCGHCDQRSAVVEGLALRDHLGVDFKHVAVDDFDLTAGRV